MSKYLRGKERIITIEETAKLCSQVYDYSVLNMFVLQSILEKCPSSDNIEDLCDDFVERKGIKYGVFKNGKKIKYVAKLNEKGEWELLENEK